MNSRPKRIFISTGELSGEMLAVSLVKELLKHDPSLEFFGISGELLEKEGVKRIIDTKDLSVIGFGEVLTMLPKLVRLEEEIFRSLDEIKPDLAILVDYPGFHFRIAPSLKARGIKVVQYVAPKVWAWGQSRVKKLKKNFDVVLGVLPFEVDFFKKHGVPYHYVGSPHWDRVKDVTPLEGLVQFKGQGKLIALLPGSRRGEIKRLLIPLLSIAKELFSRDSSLRFVIPIAQGLDASKLEAQVCNFWGKELVSSAEHTDLGPIRMTKGHSLEVLKASDFAVVTSGTATLECALIGTPQVIVYKASALSYAIGSRLLKVPWVGLVNLCAGRELAKEFLQKFSTEEVSNHIGHILFDHSRYTHAKSDLNQLRLKFKGQAEMEASRIILEILDFNPCG
jgi:lipid-A-disaccharide synthase